MIHKSFAIEASFWKTACDPFTSFAFSECLLANCSMFSTLPPYFWHLRTTLNLISRQVLLVSIFQFNFLFEIKYLRKRLCSILLIVIRILITNSIELTIRKKDLSVLLQDIAMCQTSEAVLWICGRLLKSFAKVFNCFLEAFPTT